MRYPAFEEPKAIVVGELSVIILMVVEDTLFVL
jgi:hypothetical protein